MGLIAYLIIFVSGFMTLYVLLAVVRFAGKVWWNPLRVQYKMKLQGITGPSYKFLYGNTKEILVMRRRSMEKPMDDLSHHIFPRILPHVHSWMNNHGN